MFEYLPKNILVPDKNPKSLIDIDSSLLKRRTIFIEGEINQESALLIVKSLLLLYNEDPEKEIKIFISSGGGSATHAFAIIDIMRYLSCEVSTYVVGYAASAAAVISAAGRKGKRFILPNSQIMIHQPSYHFSKDNSMKQTELDIYNFQLKKTREVSVKLLAEFCGQPESKVDKDIENDNWMDADDAVKYGLVDHIVSKGKNSQYLS